MKLKIALITRAFAEEEKSEKNLLKILWSATKLMNGNQGCQGYVPIILSPSVFTTPGIYNYTKLLMSNLKKYQRVETRFLPYWKITKIIGEIGKYKAIIFPHCRFVDIILIFFLYPFLLLAKKPIIIFIHDVHGLFAKTKNLIWFLVIFLRSSIIPRLPNVYTVFNSNYTKYSVRTIFNTPMTRSFLIYPIIPRKFGSKYVPEKEGFILIFGRIQKILEEIQYFADVIKGYALALKRGLRWRLLVAGAGTDFEIEKLKSVVNEMVPQKYHEFVVVMPNVTNSEKERLLHNANVLVYPISEEGLGLPVLEAISQGTPVITLGKTALREIVGDAGILLDTTSTELISSILLRLYNDEEYLKTLRIKTISRYRKLKFSSLQSLETLLESLH